jgi:hypothetical protein
MLVGHFVPARFQPRPRSPAAARQRASHSGFASAVPRRAGGRHGSNAAGARRNSRWTRGFMY